MDLGPLTGRIAGAPISWGVCEAPGWGYELPPSVVLSEMAQLGLSATELGPTGYLGPDATAVRAMVEKYGIRLVGGFLPVTLHLTPDMDLTEPASAIRTLAEAGADVVVLAADAGPAGYDQKARLDDDEWSVLAANLRRVVALADDLGLRSTLHPHVGTAIETRDAVLRLLDSCDIPLCLDTGHLAIGGTEPMELVTSAAERIGHVHLKDVRRDVAQRVADGSVTFIDGVRSGLFAPLGQGDLDIAGIVAGLEKAGFSGWYVLEQDTTLVGPPAPGQGPIVDVRASVDYLRRSVVPALGRKGSSE